MSYEIRDMECPGCGFPVDTNTEICPQCGRKIVIRTFTDINSYSDSMARRYAESLSSALRSDPENVMMHAARAFCFLKLCRFEEAADSFAQAIDADPTNPDMYFYNAICLLNGESAFRAKKPTITKITELLNAALKLDAKGIYYYLLAYIRRDFHERKGYNCPLSSEQTLHSAHQAGVSAKDIEELWNILDLSGNVNRPAGL